MVAGATNQAGATAGTEEHETDRPRGNSLTASTESQRARNAVEALNHSDEVDRQANPRTSPPRQRPNASAPAGGNQQQQQQQQQPTAEDDDEERELSLRFGQGVGMHVLKFCLHVAYTYIYILIYVCVCTYVSAVDHVTVVFK